MTSPARDPRLIQRYRDFLQTRHYACRTVKTYGHLEKSSVGAIRRLA